MRRAALIPLFGFLFLVSLFLLKLIHDNGESVADPHTGKEARPLTVSALLPEGEAAAPLEAFKGKTVLVNFFASWCVPCLAEQPALQELHEKGGVVIYGVAWNDTPEHITAWLKEHGNPYDRVAMDVKGQTGIDFGITGVPENYLVGPEGKILWHFAGPLNEALRDEVAQRMKAR